VSGTQMDNFGTTIITIKANNMEAAVGGG